MLKTATRSLISSAILALAVTALPAHAKEFKVDCSSQQDCMTKGDELTKKRKLSLAQEAYRNAIKFNAENKDAWKKFEQLTVRISEEGGC